MKFYIALKLRFFIKMVSFIFLLNNCFFLPEKPSKSQLHKLVDSCIFNLTGCGNQVTIDLPQDLPEINIKDSINSKPYLSNDTYGFGTTDTISSKARDLTIENLGVGVLNLTGSPAVVLSGADVSQFSVTQPNATSISMGESQKIIISFTPKSVGPKKATITILNNDTDENPYIIYIDGTGSLPL